MTLANGILSQHMEIILSILIFLAGLILVVWLAEKLVEGAVWTSRGWGVSVFIISVVFIGFDPENLVLGSVASSEGIAGIALGTIVGSAMVAVALAFGITAVISPMKFEQVPVQVLLLPVLAVLLMALLSLDGLLSRTDGVLLLMAYVLSVSYLLHLSKKGLDIRSGGEVAESLQKRKVSRWRSTGLLLLSLAGIVAGSELLLYGARGVMSGFGLSETVFGMTVLALSVSIEELARELPAALKGRPDISFGNVVGSVLAFYLFNAGIISLIHPVAVSDTVRGFYIPLCLGTIMLISLFMIRRSVPRWAGILLILLYFVFFAGGYLA